MLQRFACSAWRGRPWVQICRRAASYGSSNLTTLGVESGIDIPARPDDKPESLVECTGVPQHYFEDRTARIFVPARNAMQSGSHGTHHWRVVFDNCERWENPLMGWVSTADPLSNICLEFDTKEQAMQYCQRQGWAFEVEAKMKKKPLRKSYAENFHYSKRTRIGNK